MASSINTKFSSIPEVHRYFQEHDELTVPANQPLEISDVSILTNREGNIFDAEEVWPEVVAKKIVYFFNKLFAPMAKAATCAFPDGEVEYHIRDAFSLKHSKGFTVSVKSERIYTYLSDLLEGMVAASIQKVVFSPGQHLTILGVTKKESALDSIESSIQRVFGWRVPAGFTTSIKFAGEVSVSNGTTIYADPKPQRSFSISSAEGWEISLKEKQNFTYSAFGLRQRFKTKPELTVPKGAVLRIEDDQLSLWQDQFSQLVFNDPYPIFALNQIFLPLGKEIRCVASLDAKWGINWLEITSEETFTLTIAHSSIAAHIHTLGQSLIDDRRSYLPLQPNQSLILYGMTKEEFEQTKQHFSADQLEMGLSSLLIKHLPLGFFWDFWPKNLKVSVFSSGKGYGIKLVSSKPWNLSLERVDGETLILNILNHASPELHAQLLEYDTKAIKFLIFRALFYYCCEDFRFFRSKELPPFLKPATQKKIEALIEDEDFSDRITQLSQKERSDLRQILQYTPEKFDQLDIDKLSEKLKKILKPVLVLVYNEMQGTSPFVTECIPQILSKDLKKMLKIDENKKPEVEKKD